MLIAGNSKKKDCKKHTLESRAPVAAILIGAAIGSTAPTGFMQQLRGFDIIKRQCHRGGAKHSQIF